MKRATQLFSEKSRRRVSSAIRDAELKTSAEIVPVVATASGRYDRAEAVFGFLMSLILVSLGWLICPYLHPQADWGQGMFLNSSGLLPFLVTMVIGFALGNTLASYVPVFKLPFVPNREMQEEVMRAAQATFMSSKIRKTKGATGILLYISLLEHRVIVLPDEMIAEKLPDHDWKDICDILVDGMKQKHPVPALEQAIERCGNLLKEVLPREQDDVDELKNELFLID